MGEVEEEWIGFRGIGLVVCTYILNSFNLRSFVFQMKGRPEGTIFIYRLNPFEIFHVIYTYE